jgi:hypothetical protein
LQHTDAHFENAQHFCHEVAAKRTGFDPVNGQGKFLAETAAATIRDEGYAGTATQKFSRKSFGGKNVASGAAGCEEKKRGFSGHGKQLVRVKTKPYREGV